MVDDNHGAEYYNRNMATTVLLIGHGMFQDGLKRLLEEQAHMSILGTAANWQEALKMVAQSRPDVLIVAQEGPEMDEPELASLLGMSSPPMKVIYLTLAESRMVVHDRQEVAGATVDHLLQALQVSPELLAPGHAVS